MKKPKHAGGRPTALTPEIKRTILAALKGGVFISTAVQIAGIAEKTLYNWIKRGQSENPEDAAYREFVEDCEKTIAMTEASAVARIRAAGKKNWKAIAWWLSRRHPKKWGSDKGEQLLQPRRVSPLLITSTRNDPNK